MFSFFRSPSRRPRPARRTVEGSSLEALESRIAPAALTFTKGTLLYKGDPSATLTFTQTSDVVNGATVITTHVMEGKTELTGTAPFAGVKNIVVHLASTATDTNPIGIKLLKLPGSVEVLAPTNATTYVTVSGPIDRGTDATVKSILLKGGAGLDMLVAYNLNVAEGIVFPGGKGGNIASLGSGKVGTNVSFTDVPYVNIDTGLVIGGNLLITQRQNVTESFTLSNGSRVNGNVTIFGGPGSTTINAYGAAGGQVVVNAGGGPSAFNVALKAASLNFVGGSSQDEVMLLGSDITGDVTINVAGGNNKVWLDVGPAQLFGDFHVGHKLTVAGGGGDDSVRLFHDSYKVKVDGNAVFSLGNGANLMGFTGDSGGAKVRYTGGGGVDTVSCYGLTAPSAAFYADLGGNDDFIVLTANLAKATLIGGSGRDEIGSSSILPVQTTKHGFEVNG